MLTFYLFSIHFNILFVYKDGIKELDLSEILII